MSRLEKKCPVFYHKLPDPTIVLDYSLWVPGYEWKPEPKEEIVEGDEEDEEEDEGDYNEEDAADQLAGMVEEDELKKEFDSVASGGNITTDKAADLARRMGLAPSNDDLEKSRKETGGQMDYKTFQKFLGQCTHPEDNPAMLSEFFQHYDPTNSGFLSKKQIRNLLKTWGEPLSDDEVNIVLGEFAQSDQINYLEFVEQVMKK